MVFVYNILTVLYRTRKQYTWTKMTEKKKNTFISRRMKMHSLELIQFNWRAPTRSSQLEFLMDKTFEKKKNVDPLCCKEWQSKVMKGWEKNEEWNSGDKNRLKINLCEYWIRECHIDRGTFLLIVYLCNYYKFSPLFLFTQQIGYAKRNLSIDGDIPFKDEIALLNSQLVMHWIA